MAHGSVALIGAVGLPVFDRAASGMFDIVRGVAVDDADGDDPRTVCPVSRGRQPGRKPAAATSASAAAALHHVARLIRIDSFSAHFIAVRQQNCYS